MLKYLSLLLSLIFIPFQNKKHKIPDTSIHISEGSIIITVVKSDTIWMGADTKFVIVNSKNETVGSYNKTKIYQEENIFFGFTGIGSMIDGDRIINFEEVIRTIIKKEKEFNKVFKISNDSILGWVNKFFYAEKIKKSNSFINRFLNQGTLFSIIMVTFKNGKPNYLIKMYELRTINNVPTAVVSDSQKYNNQNMVLLRGHRDYVKSFLNKTGTYFKGFSKVKDRIVCLIKLQADNDSSVVGMPADVVTIYKNGYKWSLNNRKCTIH